MVAHNTPILNLKVLYNQLASINGLCASVVVFWFPQANRSAVSDASVTGDDYSQHGCRQINNSFTGWPILFSVTCQRQTSLAHAPLSRQCDYAG
jgi:hypothetical protein